MVSKRWKVETVPDAILPSLTWSPGDGPRDGALLFTGVCVSTGAGIAYQPSWGDPGKVLHVLVGKDQAAHGGISVWALSNDWKEDWAAAQQLETTGKVLKGVHSDGQI